MNLAVETLDGNLDLRSLEDRIKFYERGAFELITLCGLSHNGPPLNYAVFNHAGAPPHAAIELVEVDDNPMTPVGRPPFRFEVNEKVLISCAPIYSSGQIRLIAALRSNRNQR
jgi:hypothetical protein